MNCKTFCLGSFLVVGTLLVLQIPCKPKDSPLPLSSSQKATEVDYDFSGYKRSEFMRNVYLGRLELVTQPLRKEGVGSLESTALAMEHELAIAVMLYNQVYDVQCMANSKEPYTLIETQFYLVRKVGGLEAERTPGKRYETKIRNRFLPTYTKAYNKAMGIGMILSVAAFRSGLYADILADLTRFTEQAGCNSRALSQFEENLHRAFTGGKPIQAERSGAEVAPLFFRGCTALLPQIKTGIVTANACSCLRSALVANLHYEDMYALEDNFNREMFLVLSVSRVGLRDKIGGCLR